jgi:MscS family membrane protein
MYVITSWIVRFFLIRLRAISSTVLKEKVTTLRAIHRLSAAWITLQVVFMMVPLLQFSVRTSEYLVMGLRILSSLVFVLLLFRIFDLILAKLEQVAMETESKMDEQLLPILKRAVQFLILAFWLIHILSIIGVNVTALVAGISIGGLAVALAAQDTLKNLFGSVTIFLDRPFQVGDWVSFGDGEGIIEEVGIRSTRIRSFKNSLIYVPNSKISDTTVDNFGLRVYRRYSAKIGVTYNTPPDKIELFVEGLRKLVAEHPDTRKDYFEIHLNDLNAYSIDILFYIFFQVPGWSEELKAKHEIIMGILRLADEIGVQFAFPSQSIYLEKE